jgi:hypothetical protein
MLHLPNVRICRFAVIILSVGLFAAASVASAAEPSTRLGITVLGSRSLPAKGLSAVRTPLGIPNDDKPFVTRLKSGDLLTVAFCFGPIPGVNGYAERALFWRSKDGGKTWGPREERLDLQGREFGLTTFSDGSLLMTCHWLARDVFNPSKHTHSKIFHSTDEGTTWSEIRIGPDGFPDKAATAADWMGFEVPDPKRPGQMLACIGVSMQHGKKDAPRVVRIWRSADGGKSWDRSLRPDTKGWIDVDGFFSQTVTFRTRTGKILHPVRVDRTGPHWHIPGTPVDLKKESGDQGDRMMLWESGDNGHSFHRHNRFGTFGTYGEMYPRFLTLNDGRILLTFTVRSNSTDGHGLGLRAILNSNDGKTWDFTHDRLVISDTNTGSSGGGFGNTVQNADGSLVSVYSYRDKAGKTRIESIRWALPTR